MKASVYENRSHFHSAPTPSLCLPQSRLHLLAVLHHAAVILPGGFGTLDEFFEMLTWNQLKIHSKRIFLLNSGGFYSSLIQHLRNLEEQGFLYDRLDDRITICDTPADIAIYLR